MYTSSGVETSELDESGPNKNGETQYPLLEDVGPLEGINYSGFTFIYYSGFTFQSYGSISL